MIRAKSALFLLVSFALLTGAFAFGRQVRLSATAPLRQANAVAAEQAQRNHWTVEALGSSSTGAAIVPTTAGMTHVASNDVGGDDASGDGIYGSNSPLVTFQQVYELLKEQYVNKIPSDTPLAHGAVSALIAALDDPNSRFLEAGERSAIEQQDKGVFAGTGILFTVRKSTVDGLLERQLTVIDPITGSPAEKAGLETGDVITDINGHWVVSFDPFAAQVKLFKSLSKDPVSFNHAVDATESKIKDGLTLPQAQTILDTVQTTPVNLTVLRNGKSMKITVDGSQTTQVADVSSKLLPDGNGYIRFYDFAEDTGAHFAQAFAAVSAAPGIVIDLRDCPGGSIDPALVIGQSLDANQPLGTVIIRDNHGQLDKTAGFTVKPESLVYSGTANTAVTPISYTGHIAVLVDQGTANTAELLAAFLHDRLGAHLVGSSTFGDGMATTLFPMPDGSGFTLTTGQVKTSSDLAFEARGITPDVVLAQSDADGDVALQKAEDALAAKPVAASSTAAVSKEQKS